MRDYTLDEIKSECLHHPLKCNSKKCKFYKFCKNNFGKSPCFWNYKDLSCIEEILHYDEKEYLENVCEPYKYKIISIMKVVLSGRKYISINIKGTNIMLPIFKDLEYEGMEEFKEYTIQELRMYIGED